MTVLLDVFDSGNPPWRPFVFPCDIPMQTVRIVKIRTHMNAGRHSCRNRNTIVVGGGESSLQSSQFDVQKRDVIVEQSNAAADLGTACAARQKLEYQAGRQIVSNGQSLAILTCAPLVL